MTLLAEIAEQREHAMFEIILPAIAGGVVGVLLVIGRRAPMFRVRDPRRAQAVTASVIAAVAILGTVANSLPRSVDAVLSGFAIGFCVALAHIVASRVRKDSEFRKKVTSGIRRPP